MLKVSRQGYYRYLESKERPDKHAELLAAIQAILDEDEENASYGRKRMIDALRLRGHKESDSTIYRVMRKYGLLQQAHPPKGLTVADKAAHKSDNLLNRDFSADAPCEKLVSDITQLPTADGNLYISGVFDCFDNCCLGLSMDDNMKTPLVIQSLASAHSLHGIRGAIFHTDRGSQYTSDAFRDLLEQYEMKQSLSGVDHCYDNARMESFFATLKKELIYRLPVYRMTIDEVKAWIFQYVFGYYNRIRVTTVNPGGWPPSVYREMYMHTVAAA